MSLTVIEILLAVVAASRGWRVAPVLLVALPLLASYVDGLAEGLLRPLLGGVFDPAGTASALAHGLALLGLAVACWGEPAEGPTAARRLERPRLRRTGPLYQI